MKAFVSIKFPNAGRSFQIATNVIYGALINSLIAKDPEAGPDATNAKAKAIFEDELQLALWIKDNMTWPELRPKARIIGAEASKLESEWEDAELSFQDNPIPFPDISGEVFLDLPIQAIQQRMMQEGNTLSIMAMQGDDGQPRGAVCVVQGPPGLVAAYINVLGQFGGFVENMQRHAQQTIMAAPEVPAINGQDVEGAANDGPTTH